MTRYRFTTDSRIRVHATSSVHGLESSTRAVRGEAVLAVSDGRITLDPAPSGHVELDVEDLASGNLLQDREVLRHVDSNLFPTIRWELVEASGGPDRFAVAGTLTFHGVDRRVDGRITAAIEHGRLHVQGEQTFDVRDFGVTPPRLFTLKVHPHVRVVAHLVGRPV